MTPKVSVCIDVYNYGRFLPEAVESVLNQTYQDFEVVIADDASTDDSFEVAQRYAGKDSRIRVWRNEQNLGMVKNRNVCLRLARGEYIKWLHADDFLCSPDTLSRMAAALDGNPAVALVACALKMVDEASRQVGSFSYFREQRPIAGTTVINRCIFEQRNLIGGPSAVMFRRSLTGRGFDEEFFVMADQEMWFHILEQGCFVFIPEQLCAFRVHKSQQTEKDKLTMQPALENRELQRRYIDKLYVRLRRWVRSYLEFDQVRRIVRRSRKIGAGCEEAEKAVQEYGGWGRYRGKAVKHGLFRDMLIKFRRVYERNLQRSGVKPSTVTRPTGINMCGFVQSVYGIGESSRAIWRAVQATGLPCVLMSIPSKVHSNADDSVGGFTRENPYSVNLMTFSFDYSRRFYRDMGPRFFNGRYNIGLWYWEQERFPNRWHSSFDYYDEIWVVTEFTRAALAAVSPVPVRTITYPFYLDESLAIPDRGKFGLKPDSYVFLFNFDYYSTTHRKNPAGVIQAFRRAFRSGDDAVLVLKSINHPFSPEGRSELRTLAEGARVIFLEEHAPQAEMLSLFASADCYVSLHRSEGLGLGMVQAMYLGKPVIATGYSGNLDFMNETNSLLVKHTIVEMTENAGAYEPGTHWAEASVEHAAELMRWVFENRDAAQTIGRRAAASIRQTLDPARTARQIADRVREVSGGA